MLFSPSSDVILVFVKQHTLRSKGRNNSEEEFQFCYKTLEYDAVQYHHCFSLMDEYSSYRVLK